MGSTADRLLLPEQLTRVLLLHANDLRFGAVPNLFVRHPAALPLACSYHAKTASDPTSMNLRLRSLQMVKSRNGVG